MSVTPKSTVVPFVIRGEGTGVAQHVVVPDSPHAFDTDAYPAFGGNDEAPSPLFYALASLSSCNQVTASLVAKDLGIALGKLQFDVHGDLDTAVLVTGAEGNANFDRVTLRAKIESDATPEQFAQLESETERRCPVSQLFKRSGTELDVEWTQAPLPVAA